MGIIIVFAKKRKKAKTILVGETSIVLALTVSIYKVLSEKISSEKGISLEKAEKLVIEMLQGGLEMMKKENG